MNRINAPLTVPDIPVLDRTGKKDRRGAGFFLFAKPGAAAIGALCVGIGGAGIFAYSRFAGRGEIAVDASAFSVPVSGEARRASAAKVAGPAGDSLEFFSRANKGEIQFSQPQAASQGASGKGAGAASEGAAADSAAPAGADMSKQGLESAREQFLQKLTTDTNSASSAGSGSGAAFSSNGGFSPRGFTLASNFNSIPKLHSDAGQMRGFARMRPSYGATTMRGSRVRSNLAMGSLKFAQGMSVSGAKAASYSTAYRGAADAFNQQHLQGGQMTDIGGNGIDIGGAGLVRPGAGSPNPPPNPGAGVNATPYQPLVDAAKVMGNTSSTMKLLSIMILAIGAVLLLIGLKFMHSPWTWGIGIALMAMAAFMMAMGGSMGASSANMANSGKAMGNTISTAYGDKQAGAAINDCMDQAAKGITPDNCRGNIAPPADSGVIRKAIQRESNAGYSVGGGPAPAPFPSN